MELLTQEIRQSCEKARVYSQITFDDDYIVKDNKPDVAKIICAEGNTAVEEIKVLNDAVWITGKIKFDVLYRSDGRIQNPEKLNGEIVFQEKVIADGVKETDFVKLYCNIEDISFSIINSRKLAIRGLMNIEVLAEQQAEFSVCYGVEPEAEFEQLLEEKQVLGLQCMKKDILRIKNELTIPKTKENIERIICSYIDIRNKDCSFSGSEFVVQGEAYISILYLSEEQQTQWYETMMPFSGKITCERVNNPDVFWSRVNLIQNEIEAQTDYDKEMRQLAIELVFDVDVKAWKEEKISVLSDVYSIKKSIEPVCDTITTYDFLMKNAAKCRVAEQFSLGPDMEKILQICGGKCKVEVESTKENDKGLWIEGYLQVDVIYITANDGFPIAHISEQVPFEQQVDISEMGMDTKTEVLTGVDQLQINLLDSTEYEVKATVSIEVLALNKSKISVINDIVYNEDEIEEEETAGITGYIVQQNESLWDIAKQYRTKKEALKSINKISSEKITPGEKLIIVKSW